MHEILFFLQQNLLVFLVFCTSLISLILVELFYSVDTLGLDVIAAVDYINHSGALIIDIRSKDKYSQGHIVNSINELAETEQISRKFAKLKKPVLIICDIGRVSRALVKKLHGFVNVRYLIGGIGSWQEAGLPLTKL